MLVEAVDYVVVGHVTADIVDGQRVLGGPASFAARTAQAFGLRVGVLTSAARDEPLLADLGDAQVVNIAADHTTTYRNIYTDGGRVQYVSSSADRLGTVHVPDAWQGAPLVQIATIADEVNADTADVFGTDTLMVTPQGWMRRWGPDGLVGFQPWYDKLLLERALVTVLSEEDINDQPGLEADYAAVAPWVVITRGVQGGTSYVNGQPHHYQAEDAQVVDVTGAGDVFATSLLVAWDRLRDVKGALRVAAALAARSVTRAGLASTPTHAEAAAALGV